MVQYCFASFLQPCSVKTEILIQELLSYLSTSTIADNLCQLLFRCWGKMKNLQLRYYFLHSGLLSFVILSLLFCLLILLSAVISVNCFASAVKPYLDMLHKPLLLFVDIKNRILFFSLNSCQDKGAFFCSLVRLPQDSHSPPPESVLRDKCSLAHSLVWWCHNQIFLDWWITSFC